MTLHKNVDSHSSPQDPDPPSNIPSHPLQNSVLNKTLKYIINSYYEKKIARTVSFLLVKKNMAAKTGSQKLAGGV